MLFYIHKTKAYVFVKSAVLIVISIFLSSNFVYASEKINRLFFLRCIELPAFENRAPMSLEADFADFLFANKLYKDAADEYERVEIMHPMDIVYDYAAYQRALCFINLGQYQRAENVLDRLGYTALDREVSYTSRLLCALLEVAQNKPWQGEFLLSDVLRDLPEKAGEIKYWRGWTRLLSYKIDDALKDFSDVCNASSRNSYYSPRAYGIKRWLEINRQKIPQHSPYLASWLSGIIPGAGQIYLGNWRSGINALILNAALGYLTIDALASHRYVQSMTIFLGGWNRYYFGGMMNAQNSALKLNDKQWDEAILILMDTFISQEPGETKDIEEDEITEPEWLNGASITADFFLDLYRKYITNQDAQKCQFHIGCSKFSKIAFRKRNPLAALLITSDRLQRCNPFAKKYYPADERGYLLDHEWGP